MAFTLRPCCQSSLHVRARRNHRDYRITRIVTCSAETKPDNATSSGASPSSTPGEPLKREYTAWGARIVESTERLTGPEDEKDFWEGENMETMGRIFERFFVPGLIVLGIIVGGIAARSYNEDADVFIAPPTGPDAEAIVIPAGALAPAPVVQASAAE